MPVDPITDYAPVTVGETERIDIAVTRSGAIILEAIAMNGQMIVLSNTRLTTWPDRIDELVAALLRAKKLAS